MIADQTSVNETNACHWMQSLYLIYVVMTVRVFVRIPIYTWSYEYPDVRVHMLHIYTMYVGMHTIKYTRAIMRIILRC